MKKETKGQRLIREYAQEERRRECLKAYWDGRRMRWGARKVGASLSSAMKTMAVSMLSLTGTLNKLKTTLENKEKTT